MIQPQTFLTVADNSGALKLMCIQKIGIGNNICAHIGDFIVVVIKEAFWGMTIEKSEVTLAIIVRMRQEFNRKNGTIIKYDENAAILIDKEGNPRGTRVFGAIIRELKLLNFTKIISLAPEIL
uniref:50S ribosomal protein L14, chloroplastic n=1 Tax=Epipogium roseum TaxID=556037 RepID=A0A0B4N5Q0_9ASPA|nr:ribosomal protein L14 [Epipogium roseum]AII78970.1 ribosomal protein L14 [Epipogium roseum]AIS35805.1 ribosomal protein L14 [Epipogium roseum]